jgi:hypothetical protein
MLRIRVLLAGGLLLTLLPVLGSPSHPAEAATGIGIAQTDFTKVAPASASVFAALQATTADQQPNLKTLSTAIGTQAGLQSLVQATSGSGTQAPALLKLVMSGLANVFNGELGFTALPATIATGANGRSKLQLHLLLDAGLQPGITFTQLAGLLQLLGLSSATTTTYRDVTVSTINLAPIVGMVAARGSRPMLTVGSPISSTVYLAAIGNALVTATDLPTMQAAIDVSAGAQPSITTTADYQTTFGALPDARVATVYLHVDFGALAQLRAGLHAGAVPRGPAGPTGTLSQAFAVTAKPDGLLVTASPRTGSAASTLSPALSPLLNTSASILPAGALFYAALNDPGTLVSTCLSATTALAQQTAFPLKGFDPLKVVNKLLGLDVEQDVLSWMHGEASISVLPVGSAAFATAVPASAHLSLVLTLKVTDPTTVDQKLQQIAAALQSLSVDPAGWQLVSTTGTSGSPQRILAATPGGIGYTFYNGYLIVATALPSDIAAIQGTGSTGSLHSSPVYQSALAYAGPGPYGAVVFVDLGALRQSFEQIAQAAGVDLTRYNQKVKPLLTAFKSFSMVVNPGTSGGGVAFLAIGS